MRVKVEKIQNNAEKESALLRIFRVNDPINRAIKLLENPINALFVQKIDTGEQEKVFLDDILYVEYLERKVFLYTENSTYSLKMSLVKFIKEYPDTFIAIKKNTVVNLHYIQSFTSTSSGNLLAILSNNEKIIISRRYVKNVKESLAKLMTTECE